MHVNNVFVELGFVHILWEANQAGHGSVCGELPSRPSPNLTLPGVVVYAVEGDSSRLCRTPPSSTRSASYHEDGELREMVPTVDSFLGDVARGFTTTCVWSIDGHLAI